MAYGDAASARRKRLLRQEQDRLAAWEANMKKKQAIGSALDKGGRFVGKMIGKYFGGSAGGAIGDFVGGGIADVAYGGDEIKAGDRAVMASLSRLGTRSAGNTLLQKYGDLDSAANLKHITEPIKTGVSDYLSIAADAKDADAAEWASKTGWEKATFKDRDVKALYEAKKQAEITQAVNESQAALKLKDTVDPTKGVVVADDSTKEVIKLAEEIQGPPLPTAEELDAMGIGDINTDGVVDFADLQDTKEANRLNQELIPGRQALEEADRDKARIAMNKVFGDDVDHGYEIASSELLSDNPELEAALGSLEELELGDFDINMSEVPITNDLGWSSTEEYRAANAELNTLAQEVEKDSLKEKLLKIDLPAVEELKTQSLENITPENLDEALEDLDPGNKERYNLIKKDLLDISNAKKEAVAIAKRAALEKSFDNFKSRRELGLILDKTRTPVNQVLPDPASRQEARAQFNKFLTNFKGTHQEAMMAFHRKYPKAFNLMQGLNF